MTIGDASFWDVVGWHMHFDTYAIVALFVIGYEVGLRRLAGLYAPRGEPAVTTTQRVLFYTGVAIFGLVSSWPIHDIGERSLFTFHMIEHMGLAFVVPPLLLIGTPWWLLRSLVRPFLGVLKVLARPMVALVAFNSVLAFIHVPSVVDLMLTVEWFHLVAHTLLFVTAILMWFPVVGPIPDIPRLAPLGQMGYLFLQSLVPTIPASFLTLGSSPLYANYEAFPRLWGLSPLDDQIVAGLIMKLGGGAILWFAIAFVFFKWSADEQRTSLPQLHKV